MGWGEEKPPGRKPCTTTSSSTGLASCSKLYHRGTSKNRRTRTLLSQKPGRMSYSNNASPAPMMGGTWNGGYPMSGMPLMGGMPMMGGLPMMGGMPMQSFPQQHSTQQLPP
eukprot:1968554-Rhodomonas_salina.1